MPSIFSKILSGDIPGHFVAKNDQFFAILDINPLREGHVLVIPNQEIDYLFDIDEELLASYMAFTKRVAKAIEKVVPCKRIGIAVIGLEVPHAHIHLVPINHVGDIDFTQPKLAPSQEQLAEMAALIGSVFI